MLNVFKWFLIGVSFLILSACGGGGGTPEKNKPPKKDVVFKNSSEIAEIQDNTHKAILETNISNETNITNANIVRSFKLSSDSSKKITDDKKYINIPMFVDKRFPFGYIGKIKSKQTNSDGTVTYNTQDVKPDDVIKELHVKEETLNMNDLRVAKVITPSNVTPYNPKSSSKYSKNARYSNNIASSSIDNIIGSKLSAVPLRYEIKMDKISISKGGSASSYKKASFIIEGKLDNIKITKKIDYTGKEASGVKLQGEADFSIDIRTELLGSVLIGKYDKFWIDAEKKAVGLGFSVTGLKSLDKRGKIPIAGLVVYPNSAYPMTGSLPKKSIKYQPVGMLIWVYLDVKGLLTLNGKLGVKANNHIKFGFSKEKGDVLPTFIGEATKLDKKKFLELPYLKGSAELKSNVGIALDIDLFTAGLRIATASSEIGADYTQTIKTDGEVSYGLENSFNDKFKWSGGGICYRGQAGLGLRQYAGVAIGMEYKKSEDSAASWRTGIDFSWSYPTSKDINNLRKRGEYGRVGNSLYFLLKDTKACFNLKTIVSDIAKLNTHLDRYRVSNMTIDNLKDLSDKYYTQVYLSNKIYDETKERVGANYTLVKLKYDLKSGFKAGLYKNNKTSKYYIVYGGTTATLPNLPKNTKFYDAMVDILTDATLIANVSWKPQQAVQALDFLSDPDVKSHIDAGEVESITGHSLGGGLAQLAGLYTGIDTVTINTAPLPIDNETIKRLIKQGVAHASTYDKDGHITSYSFDNKDKIKNIMMSEDPISSISTVIMDIEGEDSFYTTAAKMMMNIDDALKMNFLITGEQIYLPFDSSNSSYTLVEQHSSATVLNIFKTYTNYKVDYNVTTDNGSISIDNLTVKDKDNQQLGIADISSTYYEIYNGDTLIKEGELNGEITDLPNDTLLKVKIHITLNDGRELIKEATIQNSTKTEAIKINLLNESECKTTKVCKFKVGILSDINNGAAVDWGDSSTTGLGMSVESDRDYDYWSVEHTYSNAGSYKIIVTAEDSNSSVSLDIVIDTSTTVSSKVKKTGQTKSYDENGNEVTDGSIKDDGYYKKGVEPSYSRDDDTDIVTDHITGLEWADDANASSVQKPWLARENYNKCTGSNGQTQDTTKCTDTSGDTAITYCANLTLGGHNDWRLPTIKELLSITDISKANPAIDTAVFENVVSDFYWSSSAVVGVETYACGVYFHHGYDSWHHKSDEGYVRCVRDGH